jgi:hypothetical protein
MFPAPIDAADDALLRAEGKVTARKRKISDYTHSSVDTTVFEVWEDWKMIRDLKKGSNISRTHQFSNNRHLATKAIGLEVERRMEDANRTYLCYLCVILPCLRGIERGSLNKRLVHPRPLLCEFPFPLPQFLKY